MPLGFAEIHVLLVTSPLNSIYMVMVLSKMQVQSIIYNNDKKKINDKKNKTKEKKQQKNWFCFIFPVIPCSILRELVFTLCFYFFGLLC